MALLGIAAVKRRVKLKRMRDDAEAVLKGIEKEIHDLDPIIVDHFQRHGVDKETVDGITVYLRRELWAGREENIDNDVACAALTAAGLGEFVGPRFNTNTLSAYVRECEATEEGGLFGRHPELRGAIKVSEVFKIGARGT